MLNISNYSINNKIAQKDYPSLAMFITEEKEENKRRRRLIRILFLIIVAAFFLPWTQNFEAPGRVTSLQPANRPQAVQSVIPGRIENWFVQEGQYVQRGDTLLQISEVKDAYFDPRLLERTMQQVDAKKQAMEGYREKAEALAMQIEALQENQVLKLQQIRNKVRQNQLKVQADSMDWVAAQVNLRIAEAQNVRQQQLFNQGLKSRTELEARRQKLQETQAKAIAAENKFLSSQNELINARVEVNSTAAEFRDKLAKARSERFTALSNLASTQAELSKLENVYSNYQVRQGFYYITAPQNGFVTQAAQNGIGQTVKEGEALMTIMPADEDLAVEMFVKPLNLPLLNVGQEIRVQFDGWPAIIFSGWPAISAGTFGGEVVAIDRFANADGKYRVLVKPHHDQMPWPKELRVGGGAKNFALLNDVPVYYEIWRQINGFPPDFYKLNGSRLGSGESSSSSSKK